MNVLIKRLFNNGWISVEDQMPEDYLDKDEIFDLEVDGYGQDDLGVIWRVSEEKWKWTDGNGNDIPDDDVSYWQFRPEPPKQRRRK